MTETTVQVTATAKSKRVRGSRKRRLSVRQAVTSFVCGALAGGVAKTTIAPLDRTKILFQSKETVAVVIMFG